MTHLHDLDISNIPAVPILATSQQRNKLENQISNDNLYVVFHLKFVGAFVLGGKGFTIYSF